MKGALMQLVSLGAEDINIIRDPEITFFKTVYKTYNNFAIESIEQTFVGSPKFGSTNTVKISRKGDLISKTYLQLTLPYQDDSSAVWTNRIGFNIIKKVELLIGKQIIDRQFGMWMHLWTELTSTDEHKNHLDKIVGSRSLGTENSAGLQANKSHTLIIPLQFAFCRNYSLAIPLVAIVQQDIVMKFYFETKNNCIQSGTAPAGDITNVGLWVDYIFLEKPNVLNIVQNKQEYLIDVTNRLVKNLSSNGIHNIVLPFTLPSKELIWVLRKKTLATNTDKFTDYTNGTTSMVKKGQLKINAEKFFRSGMRKFDYFNYIVPFQFHKGSPDLGINALSFCLDPENSEPSGYFNFNNVNKISLSLDTFEGTVYVFSLSTNVLIVEDGYARLKYQY
jgi:hypothetical protein